MKRRSGGEWLRVVPSLLYMAAIFYVSSIPGDQIDLPPVLNDRLLHFGEYFVLGLLLMLSATAFAGERLSGREFAFAGAIGVLYGASDEWHQSFVPRREVSLMDFTFDAVGVITALLLVHLWLGRAAAR